MVYVYHNKVALITGGARGIGFCFVRELIKNGIKGIIIADIEEEAAQNVVREIGADKISFIKTDVTNDLELENAFKTCIANFGRLDVVINNAGIGSERDWNLLIQVNATAVCAGTLLAFKYMGKDKGGNGGVIINNASILGIDYLPAAPVYTASKHFVTSLSRSMGTDYYYNLTGVRIMCICPGVTKTEIIRPKSGERLPFEGIEEEAFKQGMQMATPQRADNCAKGLIKMLNYGKNGSLWIVNNGEDACEYEVSGRVFG